MSEIQTTQLIIESVASFENSCFLVFFLRFKKFKRAALIIRKVGTRFIPLHSFFIIRIYFIRISWLKFAKFLEYFKNKPEAEILKRI